MSKINSLHFSTFLSLILVLSCSPPEASNKTTTKIKNQFTDLRDSQTYRTKTIGHQTWMLSDLKYPSPNSFCYENNPQNCESFGRLYNLNEAKTNCPKGWKLPNDKDWKILEMKLGMKKNQADSIRIWRGNSEGDQFKKQLEIKFTGSGSYQGKKFEGKNSYSKYWVATAGPTGEQFSLFRMVMKNNSKIYSDQVAKMNLCCVRCIKE
jgi:uncharacterized protein (TIGR02145 family)